MAHEECLWGGVILQFTHNEWNHVFFVFLFTKFDAVGAFRDALLLLRTEMFDQFALWNAVREIEDETMKFAFH